MTEGADDIILVYNEINRKLYTALAGTLRADCEVPRDIVMKQVADELKLSPPIWRTLQPPGLCSTRSAERHTSFPCWKKSE